MWKVSLLLLCQFIQSWFNWGQYHSQWRRNIHIIPVLYLNNTIVEKPVSQRYVEGNGRRVFRAISLSSVYSAFTFIQIVPSDVVVSKLLFNHSSAASSNNLSSILTLKLSCSGIGGFRPFHSLAVDLLLGSKTETSLADSSSVHWWHSVGM